MNSFKKRVFDRIALIRQNDPDMAKEMNALRRNKALQEEAVKLSPKLPADESGQESMDTGFARETIVLRTGRPVLSVFEDKAILKFHDAKSRVWKDRLAEAAPRLKTSIQAVGRIEVQQHPLYTWLGTGWLADKDVIVTNRHVAKEFARREGAKFVFRSLGNNREMNASINFLAEAGRPDKIVFDLDEVLYIENDSGPDLAFLKVKPVNGGTLPEKIILSLTAARLNQEVAVIGYPAKDSRIPDQQLMEDIFGDVYDKKKLAPGQLTSVSADELQHDCSTLGGNSGSAVLDLHTGEAVGIHFAGRFLESNFAIPASMISSRLKALSGGAMSTGVTRDATPVHVSAEPAAASLQTGNTLPGHSIQVTFPLTVTVSIGAASLVTPGNHPASASYATTLQAAITNDGEADEVIAEGKPSDYAGRKGYDTDFLGAVFKVLLPRLKSKIRRDDMLTDRLDGSQEKVLKYEHFSVLMSKSRRQCIYSAVNIDGSSSAGMKRVPWRIDPRISKDAQIMKECYGSHPKFSRGHMTRREDPIWGDEKAASLGNSDSMHVTNAVPQIQGINAGIWLKLENYALSHARKDQQRISVFTGPVFEPGDPVRHGIKIPQAFWKIIAFIHDDTGKLCATGYQISQADFLNGQEFIYGEHYAVQKKITRIEKDTGLSFGALAALDPFAKDSESFESMLIEFDQIRFF